MRRYLVLFLLIFTIALLPKLAFAYQSNICQGGVACTPPLKGGSTAICHECEVGRFMKGISADCGNQGNCSLEDIMIVIVDIGAFVLGLVGALVLLMYVIGGFYILASHGNTGHVKKGQDYIKISTIGLLIVMFAYMGIKFLLFVLAPNYQNSFLSSCTKETEGAPCGQGSTATWRCQSGVCLPPPAPTIVIPDEIIHVDLP